MRARASARAIAAATGLLTVYLGLGVPAARTTTNWEVVAVAGLGRDRLAVLSKLGDLELITPRTRSRIGRLASGLNPIDMVGVGDGDSYRIVVSSVTRRSGGDVVGMLDMFPSGAQMRTTGAIYSGIALSPNQPSVGFVANSQSREILSLAIDGKAIRARYLARVPDTEAILGPLALDQNGQRLYVADLTGGTIWSVPVSGGQATLFAVGLRDVRALAADDAWVFAADGDGRRVLQFVQRPPAPTAAQRASAAKRVPLRDLKAPSAVAVTGRGEIAVGDAALGEVRLVSFETGSVTRVIRER